MGLLVLRVARVASQSAVICIVLLLVLRDLYI